MPSNRRTIYANRYNCPMHIRLASENDAVQIASMYAPIVENTAISFELEPPDATEMARRITNVLQGGRPWLVCDSGSQLLGYAFAGRYRERPAYNWSVESSVCVAASARGQGIGRALYESLLAVLALQGFKRVYAAIAMPNEPSIALHRATGFERVGTFRDAGYKHGQWRDVEWWQRLLEAPPGSPTAPDPLWTLDQIRDTAGLNEALNQGLRFLRRPGAA